MTFSGTKSFASLYIPSLETLQNDLLEKLLLFHYFKKHQITAYRAIDNRHEYVGQSDYSILESMSVRSYQ